MNNFDFIPKEKPFDEKSIILLEYKKQPCQEEEMFLNKLVEMLDKHSGKNHLVDTSSASDVEGIEDA